MQTEQKIFTLNSNSTKKLITSESVQLVVTSPPYPMIEMWDECFCSQKKNVKTALNTGKYESAFEEMHSMLVATWEDVDRLLTPGGLVCINIGDATRNCNGQFKLFSNHTRIINKFLSMNYDILPDIHWHKPTNAPNKFMGSGMYPPCAYVTYEHEYVLIFRKGPNRKFSDSNKENRHQSAYFWEERNIWFSDLWELKGIGQKLSKSTSRERSAAFPFELAFRLINMYSLKGDTIYDPFCGTGTVAKAAIASERNSIGTDIDKKLCQQATSNLIDSQDELNKYIKNRIFRHNQFIDSIPTEKKNKLYECANHAFKVKTKQETEISISLIKSIELLNNTIISKYEKADA